MMVTNVEPTIENVRAAHRALRAACDKAVRDLARLSEPDHVPEAPAADPATTTEAQL